MAMTPRLRRQSRRQLADHPILAMFVMIVIWILLILLIGSAAGWVGVPEDFVYWPLIQPTLAHIVTLFFIAPFILRIPGGRTSFRQYLRDIHLSRLRPLLPLLFLGISTALIMLLASAGTSVAYRIVQGLRFHARFWGNLIDLSANLSPRSLSYVNTFPCIFEEIAWRGVMLTLFRRHMSDRKAILLSAVGFGFLHFFNLIDGAPLAWVLGQSLWGSVYGLFYGYMVVRVESLLPAMVFHYLVNLLISSFDGYLQHTAPLETMVLITFLSAIIVVPLLILWVRAFSLRWIPTRCAVALRPAPAPNVP